MIRKHPSTLLSKESLSLAKLRRVTPDPNISNNLGTEDPVVSSVLPATTLALDSSLAPDNMPSRNTEPAPSTNIRGGLQRDLWWDAYEKLGSDEDKKNWKRNYRFIETHLMKELDDNIENSLGMQVDDVVRQRMKTMTNKHWVLHWGSANITIRDQVERIVKVIQAVSGLGSAAASLDPLHAGLAWAGICVLLPVSKPWSNDTDTCSSSKTTQHRWLRLSMVWRKSPP
jgi:hypothetical protein